MLGIQYLFNIKFFIFITVLFLSIIIKIFFFNYSHFPNDSETYILIGKNFFNNGFISVDGKTAHTLFPPLYPIILQLQKLFFETYHHVMFFEYIFTNTLIALISSWIGYKYLKLDKFIFFIILLHPIFAISRITLSVSSELWFSLFVWCGILYIFKSVYKNNLWNLFFANFIFCLAYLIRPEGIIFLSSSFAAIFFLKLNNNENRLFKLKNLLILLIPIILIIFPYIYFLSSNTGEFTISGKISVNNYLWYEEYDLGINYLMHPFRNFYLLLRNFLAPFFITPIISLGFLLFLILLIKKNNFKKVYYLFLFLPMIIIFIPLIIYTPWGRALYVFVPAIILASVKGLCELENIISLKKKYIFSIIFINLAFIYLLFIRTETFCGNNHFIYKDINDFLRVNVLKNKQKITVVTRDINLVIDNQYIITCAHDSNCNNPDYIILSNVNNDKLSPIGVYEKNNYILDEINSNNFSYKAIRSNSCNNSMVKLYKRDF